jgi:predicted DNA-binding transcriptional regulator YafY
MRADRLLSILLLLQVHHNLTARELAQRLEVSERTILRDMDALSAAGIPVVADLGLDQAAEAGLIKLLAALPSMARPGAEHARQRIHVDTGGWRQSEDEVALLPALQEAIWQERRLRLTYERGDGTTVDRLVEPLGLVAKGSLWYLIAAVDGDIRTYRASRIRSAAATEERFSRPPDFDLAAYWEQSSAQFKANLPRYPAALRIDPAIVARVRTEGRFARVEREAPPDAEGWIRLDMLFEGRHHACEYALSFGAQVEVLEPRELRELVARAAAEIVALYAQRPVGTAGPGEG